MSPAERKIMTEFLLQYRDYTCLWKTSDKHYRNREKRTQALKHLEKILQKYDETADIHTVSKKINNYRTSFKKEYNKVKLSYASDDSDSVRVPKLWYYDLMQFVVNENWEDESPKDVTLIVTESAAENSEDDNIEEIYKMENDHSHYTKMEPTSPVSQYSDESAISVNKLHNSQTYTTKRKIKVEDNSSSKSSRKGLHSSFKLRRKYSAFGEHVAEKLRNMPEEMASYCQKIISDALFYADFGNLNYTSHIVTTLK